MQIDPDKRAAASELLKHDYFEDFRDWFEDEISELIKFDEIENEKEAYHNLCAMKNSHTGFI